jgi:hypothetical protein
MPDPRLIVDWISALGALLLPVAVLVVAWLFRRPIKDWLTTANRVSVGPFELEREIQQIAHNSRQMLKDTSKLQLLLAESQAIEIQVFLSYPLLDDDQRKLMQDNLDKLNLEIEKLRRA